MSFSFGGGNNPYRGGNNPYANGGNNPYGAGTGNQPKSPTGGAKDDAFVRRQYNFNYEVKKDPNDVSLFDLTTEDDLNDTGKKFTTHELFGDITPQIDGPKWLGLTGLGTFGKEPELMKTTFLQGPPKQTDRKGNSIEPKDNGNDWNWNTFA